MQYITFFTREDKMVDLAGVACTLVALIASYMMRNGTLLRLESVWFTKAEVCVGGVTLLSYSLVLQEIWRQVSALTLCTGVSSFIHPTLQSNSRLLLLRAGSFTQVNSSVTAVTRALYLHLTPLSPGQAFYHYACCTVIFTSCCAKCIN